MGKYYNIDPENCTIEELKLAIQVVEAKAEYFNTLQLGSKLFINSVYGVFGTEFFNLFNEDLAESITLQGQDLIKFSVEEINKYFSELWKTDYDAHNKIASTMKSKFPDFPVDTFLQMARTNTLSFSTLQIYGDTDSAYITFQPIIDACGITLEQETDFDIAVYDHAMKPYLDDAFDRYANMYNCEKNLEDFELEKISRTIILLAKKNYMCDVAWVDSGKKYDSLEKVGYTGFDVVKGSTPDYCRKEMKTFVNYVLGKLNSGVKPTRQEIADQLRAIKKRFIMQSPNEIAKGTSISNYENFVMNDKGDNIVYYQTKKAVDETESDRKLAVPIHVRAAAEYNHMLFTKAKRYLSKYALLKSGDKCKWYYVSEDEVFAFVPDNFPVEFAPPMNMDIQFEKMLLSPLNRIVVALGYPEFPSTLNYSYSLW